MKSFWRSIYELYKYRANKRARRCLTRDDNRPNQLRNREDRDCASRKPQNA
jgi:hypothetical protein